MSESRDDSPTTSEPGLDAASVDVAALPEPPVIVLATCDDDSRVVLEAEMRRRYGFVLVGADATAAKAAEGAPGSSRQPLETTTTGVFAVGDTRRGSVKRVATAVGDGAAVVAAVHAQLAPQSMR